MKKTKESFFKDVKDDMWKTNKDGSYVYDHRGYRIPKDVWDDVLDLKDDIKGLGEKAKAKIADFLFDGLTAAVSEENEDVLLGDENWIPQDKDAAIEKAKILRKQIDTLMEHVAALQIYCAEHTDDRETTGCVRSIEDFIQQAIDATDCLANGNYYCKCDDEQGINDDKETDIEVSDDEEVEGGSEEKIEVSEDSEESRVRQVSFDVIAPENMDDEIIMAVNGITKKLDDVYIVGGPQFTDVSWSLEEYGLGDTITVDPIGD